MTIYYWTSFSKRKNSTKRPSSGTSATVQLKEGTSIESPVFLLSGDLFTITYVNAFSHYYFVTDIRSVRNGLVEIYCKMDPLASFKTDIGGYTALIERASYTYDIAIPDPACAIFNYVDVYKATASSMLDDTGFFALSVLNTTGSGVGFTSTYLMGRPTLQLIAQYVNTNWGSGLGPFDIVDWLQATFLKTAAAITSCVWIPLPMTVISSSWSSGPGVVEIGVDNIPGTDGYLMTGPGVAHHSVDIDVPTTYTDFRGSAPYTTIELYVPGYGMININPEELQLSKKITVDMDVDVVTGDTMVYVKAYQSGATISTLHYNIGVQCPVGQVGSDVTGSLAGIINTAANVMTAKVPGNRYAAVSEIQAVGSGISTLATAIAPTTTVSGSRGGRALTLNGLSYRVTVTEKHTQDPASLAAGSGRPEMARHQISTIPGYIKCLDASVPINGMDAERDEINAFLNSGFYYE